MKTHIYNGKEYVMHDSATLEHGCDGDVCTGIQCKDCLFSNRNRLALANYIAVNCYNPENNLVPYGLLTEEGKGRLRRACEIGTTYYSINEKFSPRGEMPMFDCSVYRPAPKPEVVELTKEEAIKVLFPEIWPYAVKFLIDNLDWGKCENEIQGLQGKTVKIKEG